MQDVHGKRIFVGLSGGVDSAVTAALLQKQGAKIIGVFIQGWYPPGLPCTWAADRRDAMRVAAHLHIPFVTLDASTEYKQGVIDYLLCEYRAGHTPNPDVMCNREVKFGAFYRYAKEHGADFIATGHYARIEHDESGTAVLLRGMDSEKDQSYFLWAVPQEALAATLFPLGTLQKSDTRKLAREFRLPNAAKRDSQGICFLGNVSVEDFLISEFGNAPGEAHDTAGRVVGTHTGALVHTIGERISLTDASPGPWYVLAKDIETNTLTVSHEKLAADLASAITLTAENILAPQELHACEAQYRYHGPRIQGSFDIETRAFTPAAPLTEPLATGQSLVLYANDRLIGGGIIA